MAAARRPRERGTTVSTEQVTQAAPAAFVEIDGVAVSPDDLTLIKGLEMTGRQLMEKYFEMRREKLVAEATLRTVLKRGEERRRDHAWMPWMAALLIVAATTYVGIKASIGAAVGADDIVVLIALFLAGYVWGVSHADN